MAQKLPDFFPERVNLRVPNMSYDARAARGGVSRILFGTPAAAASVYTSAALTTGVANTLLPAVTIADRWGRVLTIEASGACTRTFNVRGRDYLGQRMSFSGTMNGTTPVAIPKAFKYIDEIVMGASADTVTITVKTTSGLGLPYRALAVAQWIEDYLPATAGTLTGPVATQSATSGDARGTVVFNGALNGTRRIEALCHFDANNLHGDAQVYA